MAKKTATQKTVLPKTRSNRDNKGQTEGQRQPQLSAAKKKAAKKNGKAKKVGRPSKYTLELSEKIIQKIAGSANGLDKICRENPELPASETVRKWMNESEDFLGRYMRARGEQADFLADEIIDISNEIAKREKKTNEDVQAARLQIDSRKWIAAKLKPKKYGDKTDITTDGQSLNQGFYDFLKQSSLVNSIEEKPENG